MTGLSRTELILETIRDMREKGMDTPSASMDNLFK